MKVKVKMTTNKMSKEADHIYVLMTDKYRISRNMRAHWYFDRLNTHVSVRPNTTLESFTEEIDLVSVLPSNYQDYHDLGLDSQYSGQYFITTNTKVTFFSRRYRLSYVLDLSPSVSSVDIQKNKVLLDQVFSSVAISLKGLVQPFYVPGSQFLFAPEIFVTVIAYIPFYSCDNHEVLAQGCKITAQNIDSFLSDLSSNLSEIMASVSEISAKAKEEKDDDQSESDVLIGYLFEENENKKLRSSPTLLATPDISMVNMLRIGLLALQLLPENSSAGIVVVTDGMLSLPNANTLESALTQLRQHTISCSFLQVGSSPHPNSCLGFIPYTDLMKFISTATFGAYLSICPENCSTTGPDSHDFNLYHRAFFAWNFQRGLFGFRADINHKQSRNCSKEWSVDNAYFYSTHDYGLNSSRETRDQQIVRNKQIENTVSAQLTQVLSCRLREGYTIKSVNYIPNENQLEVCLLLPWRHNVNIEYNLSSILTPTISSNSEDTGPECHYEVIVEGSYNFLHDVTCAIKKPIKSAYRSATIKQFWTTLKSLSDSDKHEIHLHNFTRNAWSRNIPESIKNGVPLFYMPPNSTEAVISSKNIVHSQFAQYWKWMLDVECMQKWMHTHRINVILEHDLPLPKHLHLPNTSGRYLNIQCRQALASLSVALTESSSFILLENHSYIKLLENCAADSPHSFYLIRVVSQPPSVVIHLAFIGGTSGQLRHEIVTQMKEKIMSCKLPKRNVMSLNYHKTKTSQNNSTTESNERKSDRKTPSPSQRQWVDVNCCVFLNKPIEKILIRYDRMPTDFTQLFEKNSFSQNQILNGSNPSHTSTQQHLSSLNMFQTLSRYLYHQRWIWTTNYGSNSRLSSTPSAKLLSVLMKMRLQEGFHFAHNDSGILNLILELPMRDQNYSKFSSVVQYIIFPPHVINGSKESLSDDEEMDLTEDEGELQLITECWVEPQHGVSFDCSARKEFLEGLNYKEISESFFAIDSEAISCLLTFEHSLILCQNNETDAQIDEISITCGSSESSHSTRPQSKNMSPNYLGSAVGSTPDISSITNSSRQTERIKTVKYHFDIIGLLSKAQQAVVLFSTLFQKLNFNSEDNTSSDQTNELLLELLFAKMSAIHDREIKLSQTDCNSFISQLNQRYESNFILFAEPEPTSDKLSENVGRFRCFCKKLNANSLLITIIPSTFRDLKLSIFGNNSQSINSLNIFHEIDENNSSGHLLYGSLSLPIFIYKTSFNGLSEQLIHSSDGKHWKDLYFDNTYRSQKSDSSNYPFKPFKANEPENESLNKGSLKQFCRSLQVIYWNCMTQALYQSLQLGYSIDKRDIHKIVENISEKIVLNIDISKFLIYICEHLKEYLIRANHNDPNFDVNLFIENTFNNSNDNSSENITENKLFSLNEMMESLNSCTKDIKELHSDIKNKFYKTIENYMSPIPMLSSFYFFNCKPKHLNENSLSDSNLIDKSLVDSTTDFDLMPKLSAATNTTIVSSDTKANKSDDSCSYSTLKSFPKNETQEENTSLSKSNSSKVSCNALDLMSEDMSLTPNVCTTSKVDNSTTDTYLDTSTQPLFLRLSCSIQTQFAIKECSLNFLPTCLQEIIALIDCHSSETLLQEFKVTLNMICLTQSEEISASSLLPLLQKRDSVVSNEFQSNIESKDQIIKEETNKQKLSEYQFQSLNDCIDKIDWLLNDEIVSIALDSYPIRESTLQMVIKHIESTPSSEFCFKKQVRLQFVFGNDNNVNYDISLNRFCESMARIKLPGFILKQVADYYYISDEKEDNEETKEPNDSQKYLLSSLFLSSNLSYHFNDAVLPNSDSNRETYDSINSQNNEISFSTPLLQNSSNLLKLNKRIKNKDNLSDDSLEDDPINGSRKRQMNRKYLKSRSASVPPTSSADIREERPKAGQSLTEADLEFIKTIKNKNKSKSIENDKQLTKISSDETIVKNNDFTNFSENSPNIEFKNENNGEEEGYEGDSDDDSEVESENWMTFDSKQPLAPKFWLIMNIKNDSVILYFHTRPKDTTSKSYTKGIEIFNHMIVLVESICKTVNQMLLLKDLHDTRMCDDLLVPIEDNDPFNKTSRRTGLTRSHLTQSSEIDTDLELTGLKTECKLTKTNLSFTSGSFSCDIVWRKHFPLHPRLQSGPSRGISAMRTFLNSFSVNNRKNLFVYQESLNSVFYLRLYEINCVHNYSKEIKSLNCSKSPSESSLFSQNRRPNFDDLSDFRSRVDSNVSDKDKDNDSLSLTSVTSSHILRTNNEKSSQMQCILLHVHGIREVGKDIKEEMVGALQKKLDEAVLDILIVMLSRNPHSKLTPEDVSFVQKSYSEPTETFRFLIDLYYLEFIHSIKVYLRQNLLTFMNNPKYTETNPEFHFKIPTSNQTIETNDCDSFLYHRQQSFGSDSKGIACIILSLVDAKGEPIPHHSCPSIESVGQKELQPLLSGSFDEVTRCERYNGTSLSENMVLIQFQIWSVGKIDLQHLSKKLQLAIKHSIWDLTLEFKILRASLNKDIGFVNYISNSMSVSEPSTPKNIVNPMRGRKTGRSTIETQTIPMKKLEISKDMSSSVPNLFKTMLEKTSSKLSSDSIFKFPDLEQNLAESPKQSILRMQSETKDYSNDMNSDEMANLSCLLNLLVRPWLDYGRTLEVTSVIKQQYSVAMRHSIPYVIKEFKNYIQNISSHTCLNAFKKSSDFMYIPCNDFEFFDNNLQFEIITNVIVFVRHEKLWQTSSNPIGADNSYFDPYLQTRGERPKVRFIPNSCTIKTKTLNEPKPVLAVSNSSLNSSSSENKIGSDTATCVAPRQKFLLLYVEDKQITLYLYNWSNEYMTNICKNLSNIISWHNSRGSFLQSVISQKAGVFQNQSFKRKNSNQLIHSFQTSVPTMSVNPVNSGSNLTQYFKNQKQRFNSFSASMNENIDLLVKHHNPVAAAQEYSQNKKLFPQNTGFHNLSKCFRNRSNLTPIQATNLSKTKDLVKRFGEQIKLCQNNQSKELQELSKVWHIQGTKLHFNPVLDRMIKQVKHIGRLNHYCLTPLLFSPKWRLTVSPVRDHSLQMTENLEDSLKEALFNERLRLRHASGGYNMKKTEDNELIFNRSRRSSGPAVTWSTPKVNSDESWHFAVCSHYIQEYVQYLQTLGFGAIQMKSRLLTNTQKLKSNVENKSSNFKLINKSFANKKFGPKDENQRYFLIKSLLGGLLVFEVGFCEPYVFSHLYSFDAKRFQICAQNCKSVDTSLSQSFMDELDKIKVTMHLHSFTYDYHLRTIHSYISGRQLIFRQGYHLTSFLDDFIKYYQKAPNYARNYVYSGQIMIPNICVPSQQLYNYIISHNDSYGMKVFRMNSPISGEDDIELSNEYVLVELSSHRVPYRDTNDIRQVDNFDVGVLITHDFTNSFSNNKTLSLKFFVLLTSQRELFPKLFSSHFGPNSKGYFKPIRLYSSQPSSGSHSRKSSTITDPNLSDGSLSDNSVQSIKELTASSSSYVVSSSLERNQNRSIPMLSTSAGICDEEITYLGYFSSHETMMLQILQDRANDTQIQLTNAVKTADIDCRRELLWTCLLPRKTSDFEDSLTIKEFDELLGLVQIIRLDEYDPQLTPLTGLHISWYQGLAKTLIYKTGLSHRNFSSSDNKSIKLVFSQTNCLDSFIFLNIDVNSGIAEICLVFKKHMANTDKRAFLESCSPQCHTLVEEFVNGCAYYMWSAIP